MSAQPTSNAAPDLVNIEIDGKPTQIRKGAMIIEAADAVGIAIPRFCYHRKLRSPPTAACAWSTWKWAVAPCPSRSRPAPRRWARA